VTPETLFSLASMAALPGWAILIFAPRRWGWLNAIPTVALPLALSALYAALILTHFSEADGDFNSLAGVKSLFASDWALLAGWVHYLAFDMFVGGVLAARLDRVGLHRVFQAPILVLVFLFGPLGAFLALLIEGGLRFPTLTQKGT
jgi:hypothetical protein